MTKLESQKYYSHSCILLRGKKYIFGMDFHLFTKVTSGTYQVTDGLGLPYAKQFIIAFEPKDQIEFSTARGSL